MSPGAPILSLGEFVLASGFFAGSYVGSIYVLQNARLAQMTKSRDDPSVIKARLTAVSASTVGSLLGVGVIVWKAGHFEVSKRQKKARTAPR